MSITCQQVRPPASFGSPFVARVTLALIYQDRGQRFFYAHLDGATGKSPQACHRSRGSTVPQSLIRPQQLCPPDTGSRHQTLPINCSNSSASLHEPPGSPYIWIRRLGAHMLSALASPQPAQSGPGQPRIGENGAAQVTHCTSPVTVTGSIQTQFCKCPNITAC